MSTVVRPTIPLGISVAGEFNKVAATIAEILKVPYVLLQNNLRDGWNIHTVQPSGQLVVIGSFRLQELPGCAGVAVSHHVKLEQPFRGKGIGQILEKMRIDAAKASEYAAMQCTTISQNERQTHILEKTGWVQIHSFNNPKTGNTVLVWMLDLQSQ